MEEHSRVKTVETGCFHANDNPFEVIGMIQIKDMILNLCCPRKVIREGSSDRGASITQHDTHI